MRERTTWNRESIARVAAASTKVAEDPRAMNQDHLKQQPAADKYDIGGPSDFAEDVHPSGGTWKAEYSGGEVKRNEIGMPEMRGDTFNHSEKTAAQQQEEEEQLEKKATVCIRLAKSMLPKTASESMIEDQAVAFMHLPDSALIESIARLASDEEEQEQQDGQKQAQDQQQADEEQKKQAQQQQEQDEQKKQAQQQADEEQKKQAQQQQQQADEEKKQAGQIPENFKKKDEGEEDEQKKQAAVGRLFKKACDAMAQGNPLAAQQAVQEMTQMGGLQMQSQQQLQDQVMALVQQAMSQQQQPAPQQQQGDDQLLDQMLQQQDVQAAVDPTFGDIQLDGPNMDVGEAKMGSEDEVLNTLFASHTEVREASLAQSIQTGSPVRTASTRTVGTRPTAGVAHLGGGVSAPSSSSDVDKLAGLWQSAPDVKNVFG